MANIENDGHRLTNRIRQVARIWSLVVIGFTLMMLIAHAVVPDPHAIDYPPVENLLPLAMSLSVAGLGIAWRWEGLGGTINIVFFLLNLALYWWIRGEFFPLRAVATFTPAIIPGILFLVCWRRSKRTPL